MKIKSNAFSGAIMKQFNGVAVAPLKIDSGEEIKGVTAGTVLHGFVEGDTVTRSRALFLHTSQIEE